ncbi:MAG TPA: DUF5916 domain-containing protein [Thermoanaerobaculia bacterium]|nr:DUF5916 domain-containing protein [Thermoanaerobaculia bacterium]
MRLRERQIRRPHRQTAAAALALALGLTAVPAAAAPQEAPAVAAPAAAAARPTYQIRRTDAEIAVDGKLDEAPWQGEPTFELAYETWPRENVKPDVETRFWLTYDSERLYVAVQALDPQPQAIRARLTDRDQAFQDDFVGVVLDTFNDETRAFEFFINPLGVQMDLLQNEVTGNEDDSWDTIWTSSGRVTEEGYVVELAVPFSSIRFPRAQGAQTWGVDALRIHPRDQRRRIGLVPQSRSVNCYLCQGAKLVGVEGVSPGRNIELDPTLTASRTDVREGFPTGRFAEGEVDSDLGLTARWGITPNLTFTGAVNPDFSQVEADAAQLDVNTQFALFFPEKRPFFLEAADLFDTRVQAVHSRNIADPEWGLKLTGKEGKNALGLVVAEDRLSNILIPGPQGSALTSLDDPNTSTILRYRRDLSGASTIGVLYTGREGDEYHNRLAGLDALFRWKGTEAVRIELLASQTEYPLALARDFGQPAGSFDDWGLRAVYQHTDRDKMFYVLHQDMGDGLRADLGFIPQVDFRREQAIYERFFYNEGGRFSRINFGGQFNDTWDHDGNRLRRFAEVYASGNGPFQSFFSTGVGGGDRFFDGRTFDDRYLWFFGELRPTSWLFMTLDSSIGDDVDFANTRAAEQVRLVPTFRFDVGKHLRLQLAHNWQRLEVDEGELFTANISDLRLTWQFSVRTFLRLVTQYRDVERNAGLYTQRVDPDSEHVFNQVLFSYKLNPQTVLFLGYADDHVGGQAIDSRAVDLTQADRTLFFKVGYALIF